jgi:hypothetical protein
MLSLLGGVGGFDMHTYMRFVYGIVLSFVSVQTEHLPSLSRLSFSEALYTASFL